MGLLHVSARPASKVVKALVLQALGAGRLSLAALVERVGRDAREVRRARAELVDEGRAEIVLDQVALVGGPGSTEAGEVSPWSVDRGDAGSLSGEESPRPTRDLLGKSKNGTKKEAAAAAAAHAPRGDASGEISGERILVLLEQSEAQRVKLEDERRELIRDRDEWRGEAELLRRDLDAARADLLRLQASTGRWIVHRDVKPQNVLPAPLPAAPREGVSLPKNEVKPCWAVAPQASPHAAHAGSSAPSRGESSSAPRAVPSPAPAPSTSTLSSTASVSLAGADPLTPERRAKGLARREHEIREDVASGKLVIQKRLADYLASMRKNVTAQELEEAAQRVDDEAAAELARATAPAPAPTRLKLDGSSATAVDWNSVPVSAVPIPPPITKSLGSLTKGASA